MTDYTAPSNKTTEYIKHVNAMRPMDGQPENQSFAVPVEGFRHELLIDLANAKSKGKKAYVVIKHDTCYEVQRLMDGSNTSLFYKHYSSSDSDNQLTDLRNIINQYKTSEFKDLLKYDNKLTIEMHESSVIPYSYIQRRCISLSSFRKTTDPTKSLKDAINNLINDGFLSTMLKDIAKELFNRTCVMYRIE